MPDPPAPQPRNPAWVAPLLAWVAGGVDAIGYLTLGQVFTAHMSGNSAAFAVRLGHGEWAEALHRALPIPLFVAGVALGALWIEVATRRRTRSPCGDVLRLEAVLLILLAIGLWEGRRNLPADVWLTNGLTILSATAMGLQNAALRRAGGIPVRTTFVSGMLTNLAAEAVEALSSSSAGRPGARGAACWSRVRLHGGIWLAFVAGAVTGSAVELQSPAVSVLLPLAGLAILLGYDFRNPIPVGDSMLPDLVRRDMR